MAIKNILNRAAQWARALSHLGRLGRRAATRSFLLKERQKLLARLGEKHLEQARSGKENPAELERLVEQIEKIEGLLVKQDYGGHEGVDFTMAPKGTKRRKKR